MTCPCPVPFSCVYVNLIYFLLRFSAPMLQLGLTCWRTRAFSLWRICILSWIFLLCTDDDSGICECRRGAGLLPSPCKWPRWGLTRCPLSFLWVSVTLRPMPDPSAWHGAVQGTAECALYGGLNWQIPWTPAVLLGDCSINSWAS